jgi:hypothetical protein
MLILACCREQLQEAGLEDLASAFGFDSVEELKDSSKKLTAQGGNETENLAQPTAQGVNETENLTQPTAQGVNKTENLTRPKVQGGNETENLTQKTSSSHSQPDPMRQVHTNFNTHKIPSQFVQYRQQFIQLQNYIQTHINDPMFVGLNAKDIVERCLHGSQCGLRHRFKLREWHVRAWSPPLEFCFTTIYMGAIKIINKDILLWSEKLDATKVAYPKLLHALRTKHVDDVIRGELLWLPNYWSPHKAH